MQARTGRLVDLNADLGEEVTDDAALLEIVTSANVACGYHAGTADIMRAVCDGAAAGGVSVGAQVSYLDREGFGRRALDVDPSLLQEQVADQVGTLSRIAASSGTEVTYLKPHGALYHRVVDDEEQALAVLAGSGDLPVLGLPGGRVLALAEEAGRRTFHEGFPDRGYLPAGPDGIARLVPRSEEGAVLDDPDEIARHAVTLAGTVDSVCVHGDGPSAVAAARAVRAALDEAGFSVERFA